MFFEFLIGLPPQAAEFLSGTSLLITLVSGLILGIPPFLLTRAYGWWGVMLALLAPLGLATAVAPFTEVIRTFWPHQNLHAYGMLIGMYWYALAFYLPFAIVAAGLGLWRRRFGRLRHGPTA